MTDDDEEFTRKDVVTLLLEVMDWTYVQATRERPMTEAEQKVLNDIRTALAAPSEDIEALRRENERLREALKLALNSHGRMLLTDPPQDPWKVNRVEERARAVLLRQEVPK